MSNLCINSESIKFLDYLLLHGHTSILLGEAIHPLLNKNRIESVKILGANFEVIKE
jgi:hypothetical protein